MKSLAWEGPRLAGLPASALSSRGFQGGGGRHNEGWAGISCLCPQLRPAGPRAPLTAGRGPLAVGGERDALRTAVEGQIMALSGSGVWGAPVGLRCISVGL